MSTRERLEETDSDEIQVLEFKLKDETYCVEIRYVAEIVELGEMTDIPNSPDHVEGVMELRGDTTAIVNPQKILDVGEDDNDEIDIEEEKGEKRVIVFDPDRIDEAGAMGWIVDGVDQVVKITSDMVETPNVSGTESVKGVITKQPESEDEDGEFVIWVDPIKLANQ